MTDEPEALSGAEFQRAVGTDPAKWAARFLVEYQSFEAGGTDDDRRAFIAGWFRDFGEAAVKAADIAAVQRITEAPWR